MVGGTDRPIPPVLTTLQIKSAKPAERAYKLADTGGLFVLVQPNGSKLWRYRYRIAGRENLYVIGTMNVADRSLALVDLALRRRFAFANLEPTLGARWREWVVKEGNVDPGLVGDIESRLNAVNKQITADPRLGKQFRIGHSYVTPTQRLEPGETKKWFRRVIDTEIVPLLEEYWFDAPKEAEDAGKSLLQSW